MDQVPAAPAASEVVPAPAVTPGAAPVVETPVEPKADRTFTQSELDEILKKKDAKRLRERDELRRENEVLRKLALERAAAREAGETPQKPQQPTSGEPTRDQFGSYEEFIEARAEWRADRKVDQKFKERETQDRERQTQTDQEKQRAEFRKQMKDSASGIEDFDEVMSNIKPTDPVANISASAIEAADAPGKVLHYLATNPDEAERIASLSMGKQAREIVRLEEKLAKPPVKPSKAPEPITPVGGKATVGDEMPDPKTQPDKWIKWRDAQVRAKKQGARA